MHELVRWDPQFDWTHRFFHSNDWVAIAGAPPDRRAAPRVESDRVRGRDELRVRDRLHEPPVRRARGASRTASATACSRRWCKSIQTDEARHAQIGRRGARDRRRARSARTRSTSSTSGSGGTWQFFAVVTGFAMDYLTPLAASHDVVQGVHGGVGARPVRALARRRRPREAVVLGPVRREHRHLPPHGLRERLHATARRCGSTVALPGPDERAWLAREYPATWRDIDPIWERISERWRAGGPERRVVHARHDAGRLLRALSARAVRRHAVAKHGAHA